MLTKTPLTPWWSKWWVQGEGLWTIPDLALTVPLGTISRLLLTPADGNQTCESSISCLEGRRAKGDRAWWQRGQQGFFSMKGCHPPSLLSGRNSVPGTPSPEIHKGHWPMMSLSSVLEGAQTASCDRNAATGHE